MMATTNPELRAEITDKLARAGIDSARAEASLLIRYAGGPERVIGLAERRARGEPLQYVLGSTGFRRLELLVGPGVFIPRPETEVVTEHAMHALPYGGVLVDVCTGSGAIALAVADERPDARVLATELSQNALSWAVTNRHNLGLDIELISCDLLSGLPPELLGAVDVVVANPPYVADEERSSMPGDVIDHEPHDALFAGSNGFAVLRRIALEAWEWLKPGATLVLEIGETQRSGMGSMLQEAGYERIQVHQDLAARDRVAVAMKTGGRG